MVATVFDDRICGLGEGPLWHPERQQLFWFDILGQRLLSRQGGKLLAWHFDECVSAAGWVDRDTLMIASETALLRFDIASGATTRLCALEADCPGNRSNDGRADQFGGFWIGSMGKTAKPGAGAIYRYYRGEVRKLFGAITIPNAICFAPGSGHAYFADTPTRRIMKQALDKAGWPDGDPQVFVDLNESGLNPDGAVVDAAGGLWVAQWGAGRVARHDRHGRFDCAIVVPGLQSTCPAFGGADLDRLFVTTAREGVLVPDALQGATFEAPTGHSGQAEHRVILG